MVNTTSQNSSIKQNSCWNNTRIVRKGWKSSVKLPTELVIIGGKSKTVEEHTHPSPNTLVSGEFVKKLRKQITYKYLIVEFKEYLETIA